MKQYARAIRDVSDYVICVISYDGKHIFQTTEKAEAMGYEVLENNGDYIVNK